MNIPKQGEAIERVRHALQDALKRPVRAEYEVNMGERRADAVMEAGKARFIVEWKGAGMSAIIGQAVEQVLALRGSGAAGAIPLVAVPFMGDAGRRLCESRGVSWIDLSGNAGIHAPNLTIIKEGKPNLYIPRGRPSNPFAPRSSRIARWFLTHPALAINQADLGRSTGLGQGFVSRLIARLADMNLLLRLKDGKIKITNYRQMLDAWLESYDFRSHSIVYGHVASRSGEELLGELNRAANASRIKLAFTGLAGAWIYDHYATFRIVTAYLDGPFDEAWLRRLSFRQGEQGSNVWLAQPRDSSELDNTARKGGVAVVHPLQVYLDLKGHPERAAEAADELRRRHLRGRTNG